MLRAGLPLDNHQHLLLGAYERTLALLEHVHGEAGAPRFSRAVRWPSCRWTPRNRTLSR